MNIELDNAITRTLVYADLFDQALTIEELYQRLNKIAVTVDELQQISDGKKMQSVSSRTRYKIQNGLWFLTGREELVELKEVQRRTVSDKLRVARRWSWVFKLLPWVKLVAVSGSVAGGSPKVKDDIDIVVITQKNRMWLSRLLLIAIFSLLGKRRRPMDDPERVNDKLCLNMWLTADRLASEHRDEYVAHELVQLVPLVNRNQMLEGYFAANGWVREFLPNAQLAKLLAEKAEVKIRRLRILDWLDQWAEKWQRKRMRIVTKETVEDDLLMFHPKDYRSEILERYERRLKEWGI